MHELNGFIVGPGMYQEWTNYIWAARNRKEQNLELCRSPSNNMIYYRVVKPIKSGEQLLAWFSPQVEHELVNKSTTTTINKDFLDDLSVDGIYKDY